ncbi:MAG: hypothetical protein K2V38_11525 [Gemmataceae bacterium]|nr:hypothetical protein [Gemmataceae bacterium]
MSACRVRTRQCKACPFRKDVAPSRDIPNGYSVERNRGLADTIAEPGALPPAGGVTVMACHESPAGQEVPCVGWLANQIGPGNNIAARLWAAKNLKRPLELVGERHERFEDTIPEAYR